MKGQIKGIAHVGIRVADIMLGFTLVASQVMGILDDHFPKINAYLGRLLTRPGLQKAAALE